MVEHSTTETVHQDTAYSDTDFYLQMGVVFLLTIGITVLLFGFAYAQDLETLRTVPGAIWSAICGRPYDDGITLPLLFTLGTLSTLSGVFLQLWRMIRHKLA